MLEVYNSLLFRGSGKDYAEKNEAVKGMTAALDRRPGIIDYGTSCRYASWLFREAGFDVQCFEISSAIAKFGNENVDLSIQTNAAGLVAG